MRYIDFRAEFISSEITQGRGDCQKNFLKNPLHESDYAEDLCELGYFGGCFNKNKFSLIWYSHVCVPKIR